MSSSSRPTSVVVLSILFFILGILLFLTGAIGYVAHKIVMGNPPGMTPGEIDTIRQKLPFLWGLWLGFVFHGFQFMAVVQVGMGLIFVVASIQFYRLRAWARWILEMGSWIGVITMVFLSLLFVGMGVSFFLQMPTSEDPYMSLLFLLMMVGMAVFNLVFWGTIQGIILYNLRRPRVRKAMM